MAQRLRYQQAKCRAAEKDSEKQQSPRKGQHDEKKVFFNRSKSFSNERR
jgi:hypothetical protein